MPTKNKLFKTKVFHENHLLFQKQAIIINQECGMVVGLAKWSSHQRNLTYVLYQELYR